MTVLTPAQRRITKRHRHEWLVPVGEVPRLLGIEGTARCHKCDMRVTTDDPAFTDDRRGS